MEEISVQIEEVLNKMTRNELVRLNKSIVRRVKIMDDLARLAENSAFYRGDKVTWIDREGKRCTGRVLRVNTKTISVEEDNDPDIIWRIPAKLLSKLD